MHTRTRKKKKLIKYYCLIWLFVRCLWWWCASIKVDKYLASLLIFRRLNRMLFAEPTNSTFINNILLWNQCRCLWSQLKVILRLYGNRNLIFSKYLFGTPFAVLWYSVGITHSPHHGRWLFYIWSRSMRWGYFLFLHICISCGANKVS